MRTKLAYALALVAAVRLALVALEAGAPASVADVIHGWLAPFCHQDPARCPSFHAHALGACFRCLGVDVGLVLATLGHRWIATRHALALIGLGLFDWLLGQTQLGADLPAERFVLGLALGAGLGLAARYALTTRWMPSSLWSRKRSLGPNSLAFSRILSR